MTSHRVQTAVLRGTAALLVGFLALPIASLLFGTSPASFMRALGHPLVAPALRLSALTSLSSTLLAVLFGTPLAWVLSQREGRAVRAIEAALQLPTVMPPAVAGVALLFAFGRSGVIGGRGIAFTTGAVVIAELFVSAPFYVQAATASFRQIDPATILVARTFGPTPFRLLTQVAMRMAAPGLVAGALMSWARALGEFGATLMFAGNLEGRTQTLPLAIYAALESDLDAARAISVLLVAIAFAVLVAVRALTPVEARR